MTDLHMLFDIRDQTAVITGGSGVLGSAMALALGKAGVRVAILSRHAASSTKFVQAIQAEHGDAIGIACDALQRTDLEHACEEVLKTLGPIDILINAAGGNSPQATTSADVSFFDLDGGAIESVLDLNVAGTLQSCQVFGRVMAKRGQGCIVNVTSMSALRPLTRVPAYSTAKAAVANFTQWLAVYMAQECSPLIRVKTHPRI
jgi:NAD(P)-dependent dehydrogenase (short-subunit alcohol dehydrogenase family)